MQLVPGPAVEPTSVASQPLWGASAADKKVASVTERVEQLERENESLRKQADGRAQVWADALSMLLNAACTLYIPGVDYVPLLSKCNGRFFLV